MEEILASLGDCFFEECILENLWIKEVERESFSLFLVHYPKFVTTCFLSILNKTHSNSAAIALTPTPLNGKGKEVWNWTTNPHPYIMTKFIIWNTKGANSTTFRRNCENITLTMLVLLETKMNDYKHLTEILRYDTYIQSPAEDLSGGVVVI